MNYPGYSDFIARYVVDFPENVPLYSAALARDLGVAFQIDLKQAKTLVNVNLRRLGERHHLKRFQKGVYYKAKQTAFGLSSLNPALVNRERYIQQGDEVIGYETGEGFLNRLGLTTQIPRYPKIATNQMKYYGQRKNERLKVIVIKPRVKVTQENYLYLQLLDAIAEMDHSYLEVEKPEKVILDYIQRTNLSFQKLIGLATLYYSRATQNRLNQIAVNGLS